MNTLDFSRIQNPELDEKQDAKDAEAKEAEKEAKDEEGEGAEPAEKKEPEKQVLDGLLDRLEGTFRKSVDTPRTSVVKQRCAELELLRPFRETRDLLLSSLSNPRDRDRRQLASLVGKEDGTRNPRARKASEDIAKSEIRLPAQVLLDFIAACDSCERVLHDREQGKQPQRAAWLDAMRAAAEQYLEKMRVREKKQEELEESWLRSNSRGVEEHPLQNPRIAGKSLGEALDPMMEEVEVCLDEVDLGMLEDFLGESPPEFSEVFDPEERKRRLPRALQCFTGADE